MPFWSDALRIAGAVTAPVLAATGVGAPLAVAIGAAAVGAGNVGADAIDRAEQEKKNNEAAERQKREADAALEQQRKESQAKLDAEKRAAEEMARIVQENLSTQLAQTNLKNSVFQACRNDDFDCIASLFPQMTASTFNSLGLDPLAECTTSTSAEKVLDMLNAEKKRRGIK